MKLFALLLFVSVFVMQVVCSPDVIFPKCAEDDSLGCNQIKMTFKCYRNGNEFKACPTADINYGVTGSMHWMCDPNNINEANGWSLLNCKPSKDKKKDHLSKVLFDITATAAQKRAGDRGNYKNFEEYKLRGNGKTGAILPENWKNRLTAKTFMDHVERWPCFEACDFATSTQNIGQWEGFVKEFKPRVGLCVPWAFQINDDDLGVSFWGAKNFRFTGPTSPATGPHK